MEQFITAFAGTLPQPLFYHSGQEHYGFRYGKPDVRHFCLLKAVRVVSALNAMIALDRGGYTQEIAVLVRTLIEFTTHIEFVLGGFDDGGVLPPEVEKYVQDYFADFRRNNSTDFKRAQVRQNTVNERLGTTLDNMAQQIGYAEQRVPSERTYSDMCLTYSNYVHAKYPEAMDLYGGDPGRFHLDGTLGTSKDEESFASIDTFIDTASIALQLMVSRLRLHHLVESDAVLSKWFRS